MQLSIVLLQTSSIIFFHQLREPISRRSAKYLLDLFGILGIEVDESKLAATHAPRVIISATIIIFFHYIKLSVISSIMKFSIITISALSIIASATQAHARRRRLNTSTSIVGEEPDSNASMSLASVFSPASGGGMGSKSSKAPTPAPVSCGVFIVMLIVMYVVLDFWLWDDEYC